MSQDAANPHVEVLLDGVAFRAQMLAEAAAGLRAEHKHLPPVWFYDDAGSQLFDEITRLDEYYPTRAERALLEAHAADIMATTRASTMLELGAGTCDKSRILIAAGRDQGTLETFVPLDVSAETIERAGWALVEEFPGLEVHALVADFLHHLGAFPDGTPRLVAFLGGTIGNLDAEGRRRFFFDLDCAMDGGDWLLLGCDLVKDPARLVAAYDDASGVTAAFNRNALRVLNAELGADFVPERFSHVALWNAEEEWIEMRLRSIGDQVVTIPGLDLVVPFADGEELRTEISAKFTKDRIRGELEAAGFVIASMWDEPGGEFLLTLARPYC